MGNGIQEVEEFFAKGDFRLTDLFLLAAQIDDQPDAQELLLRKMLELEIGKPLVF